MREKNDRQKEKPRERQEKFNKSRLKGVALLQLYNWPARTVKWAATYRTFQLHNNSWRSLWPEPIENRLKDKKETLEKEETSHILKPMCIINTHYFKKIARKRFRQMQKSYRGTLVTPQNKNKETKTTENVKKMNFKTFVFK